MIEPKEDCARTSYGYVAERNRICGLHRTDTVVIDNFHYLSLIQAVYGMDYQGI